MIVAFVTDNHKKVLHIDNKGTGRIHIKVLTTLSMTTWPLLLEF